ncbi:hypothetical protein PHYPO_G00133490 [Pangasianodon hypophthalmus]|uniref:Uncharacterized protein n=1 Tax=Pangasianodon hypophthalmus TaxID=310915 RepID=A0A5N5KKD5_PANHP|nr:hypothetical protein PHYPO_G00133490 [Pangasianodon hypophthalmus]
MHCVESHSSEKLSVIADCLYHRLKAEESAALVLVFFHAFVRACALLLRSCARLLEPRVYGWSSRGRDSPCQVPSSCSVWPM